MSIKIIKNPDQKNRQLRDYNFLIDTKPRFASTALKRELSFGSFCNTTYPLPVKLKPKSTISSSIYELPIIIYQNNNLVKIKKQFITLFYNFFCAQKQSFFKKLWFLCGFETLVARMRENLLTKF